MDLRLGRWGSHLWPLGSLPSLSLIDCGSQCLPSPAHLWIHSLLVLVPVSYRGHQTLISSPPPNADIVHCVLSSPTSSVTCLGKLVHCLNSLQAQKVQACPFACLVSVCQRGGTQRQATLLHLVSRPEYLPFLLAPTSSLADNVGEDVPYDTILSKQRRNREAES